MNEQTPREIVEELDKYIVGQKAAKRAVAIALRNRWRSHRLQDSMKEEVIPKNILMIGSTGVGKTEIARRLAKLVQAPFIKVEATKFTEVGYVGRDVESIVRDLAETAVRMVKQQRMEGVQEKAREMAEERILDVMVPEPQKAAIPLDGSLAVRARPSRRKKNRQKSLKNIRRAVNGAANVCRLVSTRKSSLRFLWRIMASQWLECLRARASKVWGTICRTCWAA